MIRPIVAYGHNMLRMMCEEIESTYPELDQLISDMWETMDNANGCGLAAPQIELPIKLFIVDSMTTFQNLDIKEREATYAEGDEGIKETFINARITKRSKETWEDKEGCLSIPNLTGNIPRSWKIKIEYFNAGFEKQIHTFSGATARMIQHEYDHTQGVLYLDYLKPLTKKLMGSKLRKISREQIKTKYPMKFAGI